MSKLFPKGSTNIVKKDGKCYQFVSNITTTQSIEIPDEQGFTDCNDCKTTPPPPSSVPPPVSSEDLCFQLCVESDWTIDDPSGTYIYDPNQDLWELEGSMDFYIIFESGQWRLKYITDIIYSAPDVGSNGCPPSSGNWSFVSTEGSQTTFYIQEGECLSSSAPPSSDPASSEHCVDNSCPTVNGVTNPPSIELTITADDSKLPKSWCGKTWIKSTVGKGANDFYSGETACVCPTTYNLDKEISTSVTTMAKNREFWSVAGGAGLVLNRAFSVTSFVSPNYFRYGRLWGIENRPAPTASDLLRRARNLGVYTWTTQVVTIGVVTANEFSLPSLNPATTGQEPTISDYRILNEQFGTYTDADGLTWKWARGLRW